MREVAVDRSKLLLLASAVIVISSASAIAQNSAPVNPDPGEIIVTATKRSTNLQNVPLSITVLGGNAVEQRQIRDGISLAREIPNLVAESVAGGATPRYRLRGIGSNDFTPTGSAAVSVYQDEVFLSASSAQSEPLYDLERVEVLRGPQGSLLGKNTTAGAISYVTNKPTGKTSGQARVVYGSDNTAEVEAALGGKIIDTLSARVAGVYKRRDGQYFNDFTGRSIGAYDIFDLRGQLRWQPAPNATFTLKGHGGQTRQEQPLQHVGLLAGGADANGYVQRSDTRALSNNGSGYTNAHRLGVDASGKVDFDQFSIIDIMSYETSSQLIFSDDDASPVASYHERYGGNTQTFTNEFRISSPDRRRFGWIVGSYFLTEKTNTFGQGGLYSPVSFGVNGAAYDFNVKTIDAAGFASLSYEITPKLKVTAGGRYTYEKKSRSGTAYDYTTQPGDVLDNSHPNFVYIDTSRNLFVDTTGAPIAPVPTSRSWTRFTWDASIDYKVTNTVLLFGRVARGFRSGNYNTYVISPTDLSVYDPETLTSYELGFKTSWFDHRLTFNATGFHYDFNNLQVTILQDTGIRTTNAGTAVANGFELELSARPVQALSLNAGYGFEASKYTSFPNASAPFPINGGAPLDLTGQSLERAPRNTLNLGAAYELSVGSGKLTFGTDWRFTSRIRFQAWSDATNINPRPFLASPATLQLVRDTLSQNDYWIGDARANYKFGSSNLEIGLWVKNLLNKYYTTSGFGEFFNRSLSTYPGERRSFGASASYRF